jgi:hypothetical protein
MIWVPPRNTPSPILVTPQGIVIEVKKEPLIKFNAAKILHFYELSKFLE